MSPSEEALGAYVDGELEPAKRAEIEAAASADPQLAARIERMRKLRSRLRGAFEPVVREPVPQRLLDALNPPAAVAPVADLSEARAAKRATAKRWSWPEWSAMAASVVLGVIIGHTLLRQSQDDDLRIKGERLVAQGNLASALSERLASDAAPEGNVKVGISYRTKSGQYCRSFSLQDARALAGIACRGGETWEVRALAANRALGQNPQLPTGPGEAEPAGSALPPSIASAVEAEIDGEPLSATGEAAARRNHWRPN